MDAYLRYVPPVWIVVSVLQLLGYNSLSDVSQLEEFSDVSEMSDQGSLAISISSDCELSMTPYVHGFPFMLQPSF